MLYKSIPYSVLEVTKTTQVNPYSHASFKQSVHSKAPTFLLSE